MSLFAWQKREVNMRRIFVSLALLSLATLAWSAPPAFAPTQDAAAVARILATLPAARLAEIPASVIEAVLRGDIPAAQFAVSLGLAQPVTAMGAPSELQAKQFITHWLDHYICLGAGIGEDYVGETSINGRCSGQRMSDGPSAPFINPNYFRRRFYFRTEINKGHVPPRIIFLIKFPVDLDNFLTMINPTQKKVLLKNNFRFRCGNNHFCLGVIFLC